MEKVLIIIEQQKGVTNKVSKEIAAFFGGQVQGSTATALVYGDSISESIKQQLSQCGVDQVYLVEDQSLGRYNPEVICGALQPIITETNPQLVLMGNTGVGKDLLPRLAQRFSAPMISDVTQLDFSGDAGLEFIRPIYGGKILARVSFGQQLTFVTVRANALKSGEVAPSQPAIQKINPTNLQEFAYIVKEIVQKDLGKLPLSEAEIIISGGRGLKGVEGFKILEELALVVNGAVGASRAAIDAGWRSHAYQVGQTGKVVAPKIYIACGISGAIQHIAGMSSSQVIIAINKDPEAPIFKIADYGIVGDLFEIVPLLTEELKKQ